jgi:selenocysteine lyase/cysteine desulfurase
MWKICSAALMPPRQGGGSMIQAVTFEKTLYQLPPQRFEASTGNIADAVGLGAAIDYLNRVGIDNVARHQQMLSVYATYALLCIPGLRLIGTAKGKAGVFSSVMDGFRTDQIGDYLNRRGIAVRGVTTVRSRFCAALVSGAHCARRLLATTVAKRSMHSLQHCGIFARAAALVLPDVRR